jgi:hypothetical protein
VEEIYKNEEEHENTSNIKERIGNIFEAEKFIDRIHEASLNCQR